MTGDFMSIDYGKVALHTERSYQGTLRYMTMVFNILQRKFIKLLNTIDNRPQTEVYKKLPFQCNMQAASENLGAA